MGGSASGAYQFIHDTGFVPYETCQPYVACSADSRLGICPFVDTSCTPINTCKTCTMKLEPSIHPFGEICREIDHFPNATVAEYGTIALEEEKSPEAVVWKVQAEVFARGPVVASLNGEALHNYRGGIYKDLAAPRNVTHSVSIVGWGVDAEDGSTHWVVRNSWGQYFGGTFSLRHGNNHMSSYVLLSLKHWFVSITEMGYFRILAGRNILGIEEKIVWATPGTFSTDNWPCSEDGKDCGPPMGYFVDPSSNLKEIHRRLGT